MKIFKGTSEYKCINTKDISKVSKAIIEKD